MNRASKLVGHLAERLEIEESDDSLDAIARREAESERDALAPVLPRMRYGGDVLAFLGDEEPSHDPAAIYIVDGLIACDLLNMHHGEPKIGKTLTVEDLAVCVAAGLPEWCGRKIYRRSRVLLMTREDADPTTRRRLWQIARARGIPHAELAGFLEVDGTTPLDVGNPAHVAVLRVACGRFDVIVIDSLTTIHAVDENSNRDMAPIMGTLRDLAMQTNTAIVVVHHKRKPGEGGKGGGGRELTRSRGASVIGATVRHAVSIGDGPERGQLLIKVEGNLEELPEPFIVARVSGDDDGRRWVRHELIGEAAHVIREAKSEVAAALGSVRLRRERAALEIARDRGAVSSAVLATILGTGVGDRTAARVLSGLAERKPPLLARSGNAGYTITAAGIAEIEPASCG